VSKLLAPHPRSPRLLVGIGGFLFILEPMRTLVPKQPPDRGKDASIASILYGLRALIPAHCSVRHRAGHSIEVRAL
jgi:hypothetical protein